MRPGLLSSTALTTLRPMEPELPEPAITLALPPASPSWRGLTAEQIARELDDLAELISLRWCQDLRWLRQDEIRRWRERYGL